MKRFFAIALLAALPAWAQHPEEAAFLAARDAFAAGDRAKLARAASGLVHHPLTPWADYFRLSLQLREDSDAGVAEFAGQHGGTWLGEKMRGEWLKWLIDRQDWARARAQFHAMQRPDAEAVCRGLEARLRLGETEAIGEARALLAAAAPLAGSCFAPLGRLAREGELPADAVWDRLRRLWAGNRVKDARVVATWLPAGEAPSIRAIDAASEQPARHLARLPAEFAATRRERELAALAVLRLARADLRVAAARWQEIEARYPDGERGFVWGRLALRAAMAHQAEASTWFERAEKSGAALDEEQHAWRVRTALRAGDWLGVARAIAALPEAMAAQPDWIYWRARAVAALGKPEDAHGIFRQIAGQPNFYGILATEALGERLALPPRAPAPTDGERQAAASNPLLARALALLDADLRADGVREWSWALAGMGDRQLLAAADFALRNGAIDRAIGTADRTRAEHDFWLRYPTPFLDRVAPRVHAADLDPAWVYGLMRQESRFVMDAKSSAGARGLMQLMPATAQWVARKIGMNQYHPGRVTDMDINVTLGTNYLRMVLEGLDRHPVLASAAYNAGPGRARKWRAETPLEGAIYAETIPFAETRDYVKKVMANAMYYAAVKDIPTPPLTERLGVIRPRGYGDTTAERMP